MGFPPSFPRLSKYQFFRALYPCCESDCCVLKPYKCTFSHACISTSCSGKEKEREKGVASEKYDEPVIQMTCGGVYVALCRRAERRRMQQAQEGCVREGIEPQRAHHGNEPARDVRVALVVEEVAVRERVVDVVVQRVHLLPQHPLELPPRRHCEVLNVTH